jgi:hypothetical protein
LEFGWRSVSSVDHGGSIFAIFGQAMRPFVNKAEYNQMFDFVLVVFGYVAIGFAVSVTFGVIFDYKDIAPAGPEFPAFIVLIAWPLALAMTMLWFTLCQFGRAIMGTIRVIRAIQSMSKPSPPSETRDL